ncbi:MAG: hypothetical protein F6K40_23705 [Okeania sp. SIO3I5]|uniref:hypothetical protein n=1 Tax=Okeania sp. SIO3I5 TaxID=2607805 RepID=UPI0013B68F3A|nr:hypothetical protein [Okeania sp. SIO3I5]NEQ39099.1 hypothetical protein [Okeania sp. SIO3I5]
MGSKPKLNSHYIGDRSSQYQPNSSKSFSEAPKKVCDKKNFSLLPQKNNDILNSVDVNRLFL